jgi:hypothetical protein
MAPVNRGPTAAAAAAAAAAVKTAKVGGRKIAGSVIYVVDASLSVSPFLDDSPSSSSAATPQTSLEHDGSSSCGSGFDVSRQAVVAGILDAMKNHKSVDVEVVVCKSPSAAARHRKTKDSKDEESHNGGHDPPWWKAHLKRLGCDEDEDDVDIDAPLHPATAQLLHHVRKVTRSSISGRDVSIPKNQGTVLHGLYWAVELFWDRHNREGTGSAAAAAGGGSDPTTNDRIVLIMDGKRSQLVWGRDRMSELQQMLGQLTEMGCEVRIAWMETATSTGHDEEREDAEDDDGTTENDGDGEGHEEDEDEWYEWASRHDRIQFLSGIVDQLPGSQLTKVRTLQQLLDVAYPTALSVPKANKTKIDLVIASDLIIQATQATMLVKKSLPAVRSDRVALADDDGNLSVDSTGEPLADTVYREKIRHIDGEVVEPDDIVRVVPFCGDLIAVSRFDYHHASQSKEALILSKPRYELLGCLPEARIPRAYLKGPPRVISGDVNEPGARALVAALAQSLKEKGAVGICTVSSKVSVTQSKLAPMILGALYPMNNHCQTSGFASHPGLALDSQLPPEQLVFLQLPFQGEVKELRAYPDGSETPFDPDGGQAKVCDDLIDAMKLGPGVLDPGTVPSPALRSWNQTIVQRFLNKDKNAPPSVAAVRGAKGSDDPLRCPQSAQMTAVLDQFWETLNLPSADNKRKPEDRQGRSRKGKKGKRALYYKDWL